MKFTNETEVKKWLRGLPLLKKDLEMKIAFYQEMMRHSAKMGNVGARHEGYYLAQAERLQAWLKLLAQDAERLFDTLDPEEKAVMTARYLRGMYWDAMEFHVHYSRRQSIRIHNRAVKKLIGQEVGVDAYGEKL